MEKHRINKLLFIIKKINWMKIDFTYRQKLLWIIPITKIQKKISWRGSFREGQFSGRQFSRGQFSWGTIFRGQFSRGNSPWDICPRTGTEAVVQRCSAKSVFFAKFTMSFAKFLRTPFHTEHLWRLLLHDIYYLFLIIYCLIWKKKKNELYKFLNFLKYRKLPQFPKELLHYEL